GWRWNSVWRHRRIDKNSAVDGFLALVNGGGKGDNSLAPMMCNREWDQKALRDLLSRPDFTLWHLLRLVPGDDSDVLSAIMDGAYGISPGRVLRARLEQGLDFRLVVRMLAKLDLPADGMMRWGFHPAYADLDCPTLAFYFLEHLDLIEEALGL